MATIQTAFVLQDRMSNPLQNIDKNLTKVLGHVEVMDTNLATITQIGLQRTADNLDNVKKEAREATSSTNRLADSLRQIGAAILGWQAIKSAVSSFVSLADAMSGLTARMEQVTSEADNIQDMNQKIFESAQRSRAAYLDTASFVARIGQVGGDIFKDEDELLAFAETVNKTFAVSGATTAEMSAATLQLSQALGSGVLRGDELNSVFESAPALIQAIANYLDVPVGQIRSMASEGKLTSEIVKNAVLASADEVNAKFEDMPATWGQVWTKFTNTIQLALQPLAGIFSEIINSDEFASLLNDIAGALTIIIRIAGAVMSVFWGWMQIPEVLNLVKLSIVLLTAAIGVGLILAIKRAVIAIGSMTIAWIFAHTTMAATISIGLSMIALFVVICTESGITIKDIVTAVFEHVAGAFYAAKAIGHNLIEAYKVAFFGLANSITSRFTMMLNGLLALTRAFVDKLAGTKLGEKLGLDTLSGRLGDISISPVSTYTPNFVSIGSAWNEGKAAGSSAADRLYGVLGRATSNLKKAGDFNYDSSSVPAVSDLASAADAAEDTADNTEEIANDTSEIKDLVGVSAAELSSLRAQAEQRAMNHIEQTINMSINAEMNKTGTDDVDGIVDKLSNVIVQELSNNRRAILPGGAL
jgi:tape measure domain-containing protein